MGKCKTALVLGGNGGMLGQALASALKQSGFAVENSAGRADAEILTNKASLEAYIDKIKPDYIFNTIAYTQVDLAEEREEEAMRLNAAFPAMLGRIVNSRPIHLVHYSTDFVFSGASTTPYNIDDQTGPASVYGRSKLAGEQALQELGLERFNIIRTAWLFGPGKKNFVTTILGVCKKQGGARVVYDQTGSPTYTVDLARYTLKLLESGANGIFHIVNGGQASWCELAAEAVACAQMECSVTPITSAEYPQKALRPAYSVLDASRFTMVTGIAPRPWPQALREYLLQYDFSGPL